MTPGQYIRESRLKVGKTLRQVATEIGYSFPYLSDVELDRRRIPSRRAALCTSVAADPGLLARLEVIQTGTIDVRALTAKQRLEALSFVAKLRDET